MTKVTSSSKACAVAISTRNTRNLTEYLFFYPRYSVHSVCYSGLLCLLLLCSACRDENEIFVPEGETVTGEDNIPKEIVGFYLLNEGNMGSNKSTLDYFDYTNKTYTRNIYAAANPTVPMELGDVGNDLQIYGQRMYAVINCSNKIEVMDAQTTRRIGQINIPNCRYIAFQGKYAYITSYAGPVIIRPDYEQVGYVAKVDTATLRVVAQCLVGFQPDELEIVGDSLYVANSGGYMVPNYERTVSVIDLATFTEVNRIDVEINLHRLQADQYGKLWVSSRGDYEGVSSALFWINTHTQAVEGKLDIPVSDFWLDGDSLYICSTAWSNISEGNGVSYGMVDVKQKKVVSRQLIKDGTEREISYPYGIFVHPDTKDFYIADAFNNVYPGMLYCFDKEGKKKWKEGTGDIPGHIAFLKK